MNTIHSLDLLILMITLAIESGLIVVGAIREIVTKCDNTGNTGETERRNLLTSFGKKASLACVVCVVDKLHFLPENQDRPTFKVK